VTARVSPTHALRAEIDALFTGDRDLVEVLEDVARLGARMIIQTAVEAEVEAFLGRARYQRAAAAGQDEDAPTAVRAGHRNGYHPTTVRPPRGRSLSSARSCAQPPRSSPPACSAPVSPAPKPWNRWSSPRSYAGCPYATWTTR
jgi:hypothetical protein